MAAVNLIATIRSAPGSATELAGLLADYARHVLTMEGAERFEVDEDAQRTDVFMVIERYSDADAFRLHLEDPANSALNSKLEELSDGGSSLTFIAQVG
ncbi:hypothetical protein BH11ACT5_BH11ACT5_12290 [soil metagenome]